MVQGGTKNENLQLVLFFLLVCTICHIKPIWLLLCYPNYLWYPTLNQCCNPFFFFTHNPKKFLKFTKLVKILETEGFLLFKNMKTCISMLSPLKCVITKYKTLIKKMHFDHDKAQSIRENLELLFDLELIQGLPCSMPMLQVVYTFIKYV